ncbi:MAG: GNAT family N-acetyltransferase [Parashewanella sp.]
MTKIITETPRLIIREFNLGDIDDVFNFNTNAEVTRYTGDAGMVTNRAEAEQVIKNVWLTEYKKYGYARWATQCKATGKVIGFCGFKFETHPSVQAIDMGYRFLPEYWGKGLATEAGLACIEYAKKHLAFDVVLADAVVENIGSNKVLEKLGFEYQSQYQEDGFTLNRYALQFN